MIPEHIDIFSDVDLAAITALAGESTEVFARAFMPEHFYAGMSRNHKRFCALLDNREERKKNYVSYRGFGKTSLLIMAKMAQSILYGKYHFICYITNSVDRAISRCENLKRELLTNPRIRKIWPSIKISEMAKVAGFEEEFSKRTWVAFGRTVVVPMGFNQTPRGLLFGRWRPDLIVVDDWQDIKRLHNEEFRQADFEKFRGDIEKAVSRYDHRWEVLHADTCKHQDGLTERLADLSEWSTLRLPIAELVFENGRTVAKSLVPELISDEEVQKEYESAKEGRTLDVFYRELLCLPMAEENQVFRKDYFRYIKPYDFEALRNLDEMDGIVILDPARSASPIAAETGIVGWSIDRFKPAAYCRRAVGLRLHPDEQADYAINLARQIKAKVIGIEVTGLGEYALYPLMNRLRHLGSNLRVIELHAKGGVTEPGKIQRIKSLLPMYRRGEVWHIEGECDKLEQQLLSFPNAKYWDVMDAAAYLTEVLAQGDSFWVPSDVKDDGDWSAARREWEEILERDQREWELTN